MSTLPVPVPMRELLAIAYDEMRARGGMVCS
jgi:hypothetical protein